MKVAVMVTPKKEILDVQGRAIEQTLESHQLKIRHCRVGKYIELDIDGDRAAVLARAKEIAEFVLHNPLIEQYAIAIKDEG